MISQGRAISVPRVRSLVSRSYAPETMRWIDDDNPDSGGTISAGVRVSERTAMRTAAFFSCARVVTETIATVGLHHYRRTPGGGSVLEPGWLDTLLSTSIHPSLSKVEWLERTLVNFELWGECYSLLIQGPGGTIVGLDPLHPTQVRCVPMRNGELAFEVIHDDGSTGTYGQDDMFWMHFMPVTNRVGERKGQPLLDLGRDTIALCRAMERHASRFFSNGARPGVVLESDAELDDEVCEALRESWERIHRGPENAHRTAILDGGVKAKEFGAATNQESQFTEALEFEAGRVCSIMRVPPHMVQLFSNLKYATVEQGAIDFRNHCIAPRCTRLEHAFARSLVLDQSTHFVRFQLDELERGDGASRMDYETKGVQWGINAVNESRAREGRNPVPGGDIHLVPENYTTLERMARREAAKPENIEPVLDRLASGGISPAAARVLLAVQNPMLSDEEVVGIIEGAVPGAQPEAPQVSVLLQVIDDVAEGKLTHDGARAVLAVAFPQLDAVLVDAMVGGVTVRTVDAVSEPVGLPAPAASPPAGQSAIDGLPPEASAGVDVASLALNGAQVTALLEVTTQVAAGAITKEAATLVITSAFPTIPEATARQIADGALVIPAAATVHPDPSPPGDGEPATDSQEEQT
jgi:HK97 family phage portal protein